MIDLRSIRPFDEETIVESVRKTHRAVVVQEQWRWFSVASEVAAIIQEHAFDDLDAPVERVSGAEVPAPYARNLELAAFPNEQQIIDAVRRVHVPGELMMPTVIMPKMGDGMEEGTLLRWLKKRRRRGRGGRSDRRDRDRQGHPRNRSGRSRHPDQDPRRRRRKPCRSAPPIATIGEEDVAAAASQPAATAAAQPDGRAGQPKPPPRRNRPPPPPAAAPRLTHGRSRRRSRPTARLPRRHARARVSACAPLRWSSGSPPSTASTWPGSPAPVPAVASSTTTCTLSHGRQADAAAAVSRHSAAVAAPAAARPGAQRSSLQPPRGRPPPPAAREMSRSAERPASGWPRRSRRHPALLCHRPRSTWTRRSPSASRSTPRSTTTRRRSPSTI